jgi:uncharacterized membrane protein
MGTTPDKLVERYLKHLEIELDDLPRDRRREIADEIAGHIAEARSALEHETEADVRNILEGLGEPADIAEEACERFDVTPTPAVSPYKPGWMEVGALVLLLIGGLIIPIFGWLIGVILLWLSNAWNVRDKIIGTLFVPGGLGVSLLVLFLFLANSGGGVDCGAVTPVSTERTTGFERAVECTQEGASYLAVAGVTFVIVAPIFAAAYLVYRLRHQRAGAAA